MDNWGSMLQSQTGAGFLVTVILNRLKNWDQFKWLSEHTEQLNVWIGVVVSFFATLGFKWTASGSIEEGFTFNIHTAPVGTMLESFLQICAGAGVQQGFYQGSQLLKLLKQWQTMVVVTTQTPKASPQTQVDVIAIPPATVPSPESKP